MSTPPKTFSLNKDDFASQADWIDKLLRPLNSFVAQTSSALASLTRTENMQSQVQELTFVTDGSGNIPAEGLTFAVKNGKKPNLLWIGYLANQSVPGTAIGGAFPTWQVMNDESGLRVKITAISGLSVSSKYLAKVVVE